MSGNVTRNVTSWAGNGSYNNRHEVSGNVTRNVTSRTDNESYNNRHEVSGNVTRNVTSRAGNEAKYEVDRVQNGSVSGSGRSNRRVGVTARSKRTISAAHHIAGNDIEIRNIREQLSRNMGDRGKQQAMEYVNKV